MSQLHRKQRGLNSVEDLVTAVIRTGRLKLCIKRWYVQDGCLPIQLFDGDGEGFLCVGYCHDTRPVDCIKVCLASSAGTDFITFSVSPKEAMLLANMLIAAASGFVFSDIIGDAMHNLKGYDFNFLKEQLDMGESQ